MPYDVIYVNSFDNHCSLKARTRNTRAIGSDEVNNCKLRNNENKINITMVFYQLDSEVGCNGQTEFSKHLFSANL